VTEPESTGQDRPWTLVALAAVFGAVLALRSMGRIWWCRCGSLVPWGSGATSPHTSQHLLDVYSFTHLLHGFVFYALLATGKRWIGPRARLALAVSLEACWELLENSRWVIERYRAGTIALDYFGDSVLNSLGDIACCTLGFLLARRLPARASIAVVVVVELALLVAIRDNLTLNVLMLVAPIERVKAWQRG
jgi:hypothetical protein